MEPVRKSDPTPVDDVRKIRELLSAEFGNDVRKLGQHAQRVAEEFQERLGLKRIERPNRSENNAEN
jgi:hypothetical protein